MIINLEQVGPVTVIRLDGEMRHADAREFEQLLRKTIWGGNRQILIDMEVCRFIDSKSILILLRYQREALAGGGVIKILKPSKAVQKFLGTANLDGLFDIFWTRTEAMGTFRSEEQEQAERTGNLVGDDRRRAMCRVALDQRCVIGMLVVLLQARGILETSEAEQSLGQLMLTDDELREFSKDKT